jgi:hypothetical protein
VPADGPILSSMTIAMSDRQKNVYFLVISVDHGRALTQVITNYSEFVQMPASKVSEHARRVPVRKNGDAYAHCISYCSICCRNRPVRGGRQPFAGGAALSAAPASNQSVTCPTGRILASAPLCAMAAYLCPALGLGWLALPPLHEKARLLVRLRRVSRVAAFMPPLVH